MLTLRCLVSCFIFRDLRTSRPTWVVRNYRYGEIVFFTMMTVWLRLHWWKKKNNLSISYDIVPWNNIYLYFALLFRIVSKVLFKHFNLQGLFLPLTLSLMYSRSKENCCELFCSTIVRKTVAKKWIVEEPMIDDHSWWSASFNGTVFKATMTYCVCVCVWKWKTKPQLMVQSLVRPKMLCWDQANSQSLRGSLWSKTDDTHCWHLWWKLEASNATTIMCWSIKTELMNESTFAAVLESLSAEILTRAARREASRVGVNVRRLWNTVQKLLRFLARPWRRSHTCVMVSVVGRTWNWNVGGDLQRNDSSG